MEKFDVVIVGAGPAGLKAAEVLAKNKKKVIVLEKNKVIGPKVCAAGITEKDLKYIPKRLIERFFNSFLVNNKLRIKYNLFTIEREKLGRYQLRQARQSGAKILKDTFVREISQKYVETSKGRFYFNYLIGADGSNSKVRSFLKLKSEVCCLAIQYKINKVEKDIKVFFDPAQYSLWYLWVFPHKDYTYIGVGASIGMHIHLRKKLDSFMQEENYSASDFEAALINVDYRGYKFNNIYLVGDAAGFANPLTGEGIYQALVSGEEIAKKILIPEYHSRKLTKIIATNKKLSNIIGLFKNQPRLFKLIYMLISKLKKSKLLQRHAIDFLQYEK
ncbi:FAD-dependent oxidoreductase [Candidatus Woesearchaeota archaeon]|nr:FAD-dependent oxidoreductase [Candidatus Woesearchaeota archaeon]